MQSEDLTKYGPKAPKNAAVRVRTRDFTNHTILDVFQMRYEEPVVSVYTNSGSVYVFPLSQVLWAWFGDANEVNDDPRLDNKPTTESP